MQLIKHFPEIDEDDLPLVGGKGLNLGKLTQAGFQVPNGFCVTTDAYRKSVESISEQNLSSIIDIELSNVLIEEILKAREKLQTNTVAVRSSATAEDLDTASFAGQQDTFLHVKTDELFHAIKKCWTSLWSDRAIAYRRSKNIQSDGLAMAVVVQEMCNADVSGVLFTVSPFNKNVSIVESNWGLGESVVSGEITPDSFQISRDTGDVLESAIATKQEMITATGVNEVTTDQQNIPSLTHAQLKQLIQIGLDVETRYGQPMDIEWAIANNVLHLLQARPITTQTHAPIKNSDSKIEMLRQEEIQKLKTLTEANPTIWSHHNLAEVLPAPLPLTWEIMKHFMSADGGLGTAYRGLGFYPSNRVHKMGILDLICGRIFVNLNRETELFFDGFPFAHDFDAVKQNPTKAMYAQATFNIKKCTAAFWFKLPLYIVRMTKAELRLRKLRSKFDTELTAEIFPIFKENVVNEQNLSYSELSDTELVKKFKEWCNKTLDDFAPKALTATVLAAFSLQRLEAALQKCVDETTAKNLASRLISGIAGNLTVETNAKLQQVGTGELTLIDFLKVYGHRAVGEFELAKPRWREDTTFLEQIIASLSKEDAENGQQKQIENQHFARQEKLREAAEKELTGILVKKKGLHNQIVSELVFTRRYMPFRETAKFYLMLGYEQIRRALVVLDNRYKLNGGIFYLLPDELYLLIQGHDFSEKIAERKNRHELLLQIEVPDVVFSDAVDCIGTSLSTESADTYTGVGVSAGIAKGPAKVLSNPSDLHAFEKGYILVCPSTDPAWTPLFLNAAGLVMERGGMLSHGAVVAREYGLPAVVNISNATQNISDGQVIQVDGNQGTVSLLS